MQLTFFYRYYIMLYKQHFYKHGQVVKKALKSSFTPDNIKEILCLNLL